MMRTKGELKKAFPTLRQLIDSLWRNYYGLYRESYLDPPDLDELGEPIDPWQKNRISRDIRHGQALGQDNLIEGNRSAAFGQGNNTKSFLEIILGANALIPEGQNPEEWIPTDLLLTLGNGPDPENRSNVFEVFKNGIFRFLQAIVIGAHSELPEGQTPREGSVQFIDNKLMLYFLGEWHDLASIQDIYTTIYNELNNPTTNIYQSVTNIVNSNSGASHESRLIENTANASETIISSWTVVPWAEQVGEFKAVIMVRNKVTHTVVTLISLLSFDYADATDVVIQNDLLTDSGITLTVGVNGSNYLYATVSGMPTVNKRIHICFERCVLSHREYTISAAGDFELNGSALASAIVAMASPEFELELDIEAEPSAYREISADFGFELDVSAEQGNKEPDLIVYITGNLADYCFGIYDENGDELTDFTVDWGDGITEIGTFYHEYAESGDYVIRVYLTEISACKEIILSGNLVTGVEMSKLTALQQIALDSVSFTSIDLTLYSQLFNINIYNCPLDSVNLSENLELTNCSIRNTPITALDLTTNPDLQYLTLNDTAIESLDLSNNLSLKTIYVSNTPTSELSLESYSQIQTISIDNINITQLDLFENIFSLGSFCAVRNCSLLETITNFTAKPVGYLDSFFYDFSGNALSETCVNQILIECDTKWASLSGTQSGALKLEGGTNSAPTGAGITAKNSLNAKNRETITN